MQCDSSILTYKMKAIRMYGEMLIGLKTDVEMTYSMTQNERGTEHIMNLQCTR